MLSQDQGGAAVGGGADLQQAERVGHHRGGQHLLGGDLLAVAGVGVREAVAGVLDLDGGEVVLGGAEQLHAAAGVEGEVGGVGGAQQVEAQPVRVVLAVAAHRGEEALGGGVGPDHQGHVAQPGQDLGPGVGDGLGPRGAGGVGRRDPGAGPAEGLGEGGAGDEAGVAVADGVGAGDVLDVGPGAGRRRPGRRPAAASPYSTKLRPHLPQGCMPAPRTATRLSSGIGASRPVGRPAGRHFQTRYSWSSSS